MMKKESAILSIAIATVSLIGVLGAGVSLADPSKDIQERILDFNKSRSKAIEQVDKQRGTRSVEMCVDKYKTFWVEEGKDPHIKMDDEFILTGPNPVSGIWQVTPKGRKHQWKHGHYQAIPTANPDVFYIWNVNVKPHGDDAERMHLYIMEFEPPKDPDKCPPRIFFETTKHIPGAVDLDPGHAGVER